MFSEKLAWRPTSGWFLLVLWTGFQSGDAGATGNSSSATNGKVVVTRVVKVLTGERDIAYSVDYSYNFANRTMVRIKNLGIAPAMARFHYFLPELELEFDDATDGHVLQRVQLTETVIVAAKPPLNVIPHEAEFPPSFRAFTWESQASLLERANVVLGRYFSYLPREFQQKTYLATTFTPLRLSGMREGVLGQTALLLSFPYNPHPGKLVFHVQSIVREGRSLSDEYKLTGNQAIVDAASKLVDRIVAEMKGEQAP
jgi:hypothetical protein